jgi:ABC-type nitrate/sulfonate/bicarbonate transport system ATPase subunit
MTYELKEVLVSIDQISLSFDTFKVLNPITTEVRNTVCSDRIQGQVIGLLGPSGVGKTQFCRILSGLQKPNSGKVSIRTRGEMVAIEPGMIGFVGQDYPLFTWRTVMGNLLVAQEALKLSKAEKIAKATKMLEEFGLVAKAKSYPSQLSGGQRQRVAIIRELLSSENYVILDEPFTGLDPLMVDMTCELIVKVSNLHESNTVFVVAHNIESIARISDVLWLFGRERDESGSLLPGATIKKVYDLKKLDLAWVPGIESTPRFAQFCAEIKADFKNL